MRRIVGVALLTWCTYRLVLELAAQPGTAEELDGLITRWWPLAIVAIALIAAIRSLRPHGRLRGPTAVLAIGLIALLLTTGLLPNSGWGPISVPLALLPIGWYLATRANVSDVELDGWPRLFVFGGSRQVHVCTRSLAHGRATVLLGSLVLDLSSSQPRRVEKCAWTEEHEGHGARLDLNSFAGSVEVVVPPTWVVVIDQPALGARVKNQVPQASEDKLTGRLHVAALAPFANVTIRT